MKTKTAALHPQAKDCQLPPKARREEWNGFSLEASGRNQLCQHLDFELPGFKTVKKSISVV